MYKILPYTYDKAKQLKLQVYPSDSPIHKIKIYDQKGNFLYYGGDPNYSDYPNYIKSHGKVYADARRLLYHERHKKEIKKVGSRGWVIAQLLW